MRECWEDDAKGTVSDIEGAWRLGGREMPRSIRDGIFVGVVVVVVVVVVLMGEMGAMGVVVLMVVVGIMVLAMVVRVACTGVVGVAGVLCMGGGLCRSG